MLPEALLIHDVRGEEAVPRWLLEDDLPWLDVLLAERDRYIGRRQRELDERMRDPLPGAAPLLKARLALHVLSRLARSRTESTLDPKMARAAVFRASAAWGPESAIARAAAELHLEEDVVREALFADLPGERRVAALEKPIRAWDLALLVNQALLGGFLERASVVHLAVEGEVQKLARSARLRGLIVGVLEARPDRAELEISGPFTLFHHTRLYGYALAELVPQLQALRSFHLLARVALPIGVKQVAIGPRSPVFPWPEAAPFESRLERRFARVVAKVAPGWRVEREPPPVVIEARSAESRRGSPKGDRAMEGIVLLPDLALVREADGARRWIELVGFWTRTHLERKLERLRRAGIEGVVLCVDLARNCGEGEAPDDPAVVGFRGRFPIERVLAAAGAAPGADLEGSLINN